MKSLDKINSSSHPHEDDMTRSMTCFHLLFLVKSTWRYQVSRLLVFSSSWSWLDKIQNLVFSSSRQNQVYLTRSSISFSRHFFLVKLTLTSSRLLSSRLLILIKSKWRDRGSCLLVLRRRLDVIEDLTFLSSRLVFLTPFLVFSSSLPDLSRLSRLRFLIYLVFWGHFKLPNQGMVRGNRSNFQIVRVPVGPAQSAFRDIP